ncbi:MAG: hypothetical protein JW871_02970 [Endomicrobiales bacterium]|nr:hypothetical protein [Endomicrobiales bacterium]
MKNYFKKLVLLICIMILLLTYGCNKKKNINEMSPMQIVDFYITASDKGNYDLLRQIVYLPSDATEEQINKKIGYNPSPTSAEKYSVEAGKAVLNLVGGMNQITDYEKILSETTAEVGIVLKIGGRKAAGDQIVLRRDNGVWKIDYSRSELSIEQLIEVLEQNPDTAWAWYYLGMHTQSDSFYKAHRYYKKYYELEPNGFFVSEDFLETLEKWGNFETQEIELLKMVQNNPPDGDGKISDYIRLCQLCMVHEKYKKAEEYLEEANQIIKRKMKLNPLVKEDFIKAEEELQLRKEGKYHDILDEIEKSLSTIGTRLNNQK